jgi:hypothetical protein
MRIYRPHQRTALAVAAAIVLVVILLVGVGAYYALLPQDTIETEQAREEKDIEVSDEEEEEEGEQEREEEEEREDEKVTRAEVVYVAQEPSSASGAASEASAPTTASDPATERHSQQGEMMESVYMDPKPNEWQAQGYQTTDPDAPFYHPPSGPCLGQCIKAEGKNNADLQSEWMQSSPQMQAAPSGVAQEGKLTEGMMEPMYMQPK